MRTYDAYSETGFAAVPYIPSHWQVKKFRHVARLVQRKNRDSVERPMLSLSAYRGIEEKQYDDENLARSKEESLEYLVVEPNQLVMNPMWVIYGAIGASKLHGIVSPAYRVYRLGMDLSPSYCDYLMRSHFYVGEYNKYVRGLTTYDRSVRKEDFHEIPVLLPPREEQDAIVAFLDVRLAEINRFIANKERLIALLKEQKAAIINRAVTRGLDADAPMKPSGIEWLGEIPAHWEVKRCKSLFQEVDDRTETGKETLLSLRMNEGLVPHNEVSDIPITSNQLIGYKRTKSGEVVMNRMRAASGLFAVTKTPGIVSPDYAILRPAASISPDYFVYLFKTPVMQSTFRINSKGLGTGESGFLRLYTDRFGMISVPTPPLSEQADICRFIAEQSERTEVAISKAGREIQLIKEYRTALIADAVTGKIDVQAAVAERVAEEVAV